MNLLLFLTILFGVLLRLAGIHRPLLGNFAAYQTGQAMMAKFFVHDHFLSIFYPQVNVLAGGKPGVALLYYPVSSLVAAIFYALFDHSLDFWGRLQSVIFFAAACIYLYRLIRDWTKNEKIATASVIAFSLSPLTVIYGQSFQNEMATLFFILLFLFHAPRAMGNFRFPDFILATLGWSFVLLTRPNCLYVLLPAFYTGIKENWGKTPVVKIFLRFVLIFAVGSILPAAWYLYGWHLSKAAMGHIYSSIYAQVQVKSTVLSPSLFNFDYIKQLVDLLAGIVLTPIGFTLFIAGTFFALKEWKDNGVFVIWTVAFFAVNLILAPRKIIEHDFYLLQLLLPASPLIGKGFEPFLISYKEKPKLGKIFTGFFLIIVLLVSLRFAAHPAFKTPDRESRFPQIAAGVRGMTDRAQSKIIVQGNHTLLYYADRFGWGLEVKKKGLIEAYHEYMLPREEWLKRKEAFKDPRTALEYLRQEGATHFVVSDPMEFEEAQEFSAYMRNLYPVLEEKKGGFVIFDLTARKNSPPRDSLPAK